MSFKYAKGKALSGLFTCGYAIGGRLVNCKTREATRIFYAEGISQHPAAPDPDEFVDVTWVPVDEVVAAVRAGIIEDAKTVVSALFAASLGDA